MSQRGAEGVLLSLYGAVYSGEVYVYLDCPPKQPFFSILVSQSLFVYAGWCLAQAQFWLSWEEKRQNFHYNAVFIIGSIWSMATCQICNIIWEPADGAVTDSIQRFVYSPEHVFPSWGKYHFIVRALELFAARCWTHLFSWLKSVESRGHLGAGPWFSHESSLVKATDFPHAPVSRTDDSCVKWEHEIHHYLELLNLESQKWYKRCAGEDRKPLVLWMQHHYW